MWEGFDPVNPLNHISWVAIVTPTDRPQSVRNRCVIEVFDEGAKEDSANTTKQKVFKKSAKCPTSTIKLHVNDFTCLLDRGSEVSTISESLYHKHLSNLEINTQKTLR